MAKEFQTEGGTGFVLDGIDVPHERRIELDRELEAKLERYMLEGKNPALVMVDEKLAISFQKELARLAAELVAKNTGAYHPCVAGMSMAYAMAADSGSFVLMLDQFGKQMPDVISKQFIEMLQSVLALSYRKSKEAYNSGEVDQAVRKH